jgi:hypothetical protein
VVIFESRNNFYSSICDVVEHPVYHSACLNRIARLGKKDDEVAASLWPECAAAIRKDQCPALARIRLELVGKVRFYVDRDEKGEGVLSREELGRPSRTDDEIASHAAALDALIKHGGSVETGRRGVPRPSEMRRPRRRSAVITKAIEFKSSTKLDKQVVASAPTAPKPAATVARPYSTKPLSMRDVIMQAWKDENSAA